VRPHLTEFVDQNMVKSGTFGPGSIRNNSTGFGPDLFNKKYGTGYLIILPFFQNVPIRLRLQTVNISLLL
jgi:hypothetical protein